MGELLDWAEEEPLFNLNQAERITGLERDSLKVKLSRLVKKGKLQRIEKGKYTVHEDSFIYASHVQRPSYISLWSGLDYFGLTTQEPTKTQVICSNNRKDLEDIEFYKSREMSGFRKERYRSFEIFVAEKERLLIDCLRYGNVPVDELEPLVEEIDIEKSIEYLNRFGSNPVSKRAGYLIQKLRGEKVEELKREDSNYPLLDLTKQEDGEIDSEWRLKVNNDAYRTTN